MTASVPERRNWARASVKYQQASARGLRDACSTLAVLCGSGRVFFFIYGEAAGGAREWKKENDKKMASRPRRDRRGRRGRARDVALLASAISFCLCKAHDVLFASASSQLAKLLFASASTGKLFCLLSPLTTCNSDLLDEPVGSVLASSCSSSLCASPPSN